jgi:predicted Zn-dependent peptidase
MRTETSPGGLLYEALNAAAFDASPYAWPTVGWMRDLEGLTIADSMALHRKAYVPGNAVGAIVGDLTEAEVREVLAKTFGAIPAGPVPPPLRATEPPMRGERRRVVRYDAKPQLMLGFPKPTLPERDDFVFDVIDQLLSGGRSARLTKRLVNEKKLALGVGTFGAPGSRLPNLFAVSAVPVPGASLEALERETQAVLDELATQPIPAEELEGARRRMEADFLRSLATNEGIASTLTYYEALTGDFRYVAEHGRAIATVDAAEVQRVAKRYLTVDRRVSVQLVPLAKEVTP